MGSNQHLAEFLSEGGNVGTAAGTSTATGVGRAIRASVGTAAGTSTATGVGAGVNIVSGVGTAVGTSTALAQGATVRAGTGTAVGTSTAQAVGNTIIIHAGVGTAIGTSTALAVGNFLIVHAGVGTAIGTSEALAFGRITGIQILLIKKGSEISLSYDNHYDRKAAPFSYSETYDHRRGRTKTARLTLFRTSTDFEEPQPDWRVKIHRDAAGEDLMFGGVVTKVTSRILTKGDSNLYVRAYDLDLSGFDPQTLKYREVVHYDHTNIRSGQVIVDLLTLYAPWIDVTGINITTSPVIKRIRITRRTLDEVVNNILEKTGWTFYVDDEGVAHYDEDTALTLDWALSEGTSANPFPAFDVTSLDIETNTDECYNDITLIGGLTKGIKYVETFTYNGRDAIKPMAAVPFGLDRNILFFDKHDGDTISSEKWLEIDTGNKITQSLGRLQINSGISAAAGLIAETLFSRVDHVEYRIAELQITSGFGVITVGFHSGVQAITPLSEFIHAMEFDFSGGKLRVREGATTTAITAVDIAAGIYSIRIRIKADGGAIYFIQGGRAVFPKEYGELGSKNWLKFYETSSDTTAFIGLATITQGAVGATLIRQKVSTDIDISAVLKAGSKLGLGSVVAVDTNLLVGTQESADFETDCFIGEDQNNPYLSFFTDNIPLGTVVLTYWGVDANLKERVYSAAGKAAIAARSTLPGDDGTRDLTIQNIDFVLDSQDARDLLVAYLADSVDHHYRGKFVTNTDRIYSLSPPGSKPYAGQLLIANLPNASAVPTTFSEIITAVSATDLGAEIYEFNVTFGEGQFDLERLFLKLQKTDIEIIDDPDPAIDPDSEEVGTAVVDRLLAPEYISAVFNASGITIEWSDTGATVYELRDNIYVNQGQGGSLIYQKTSSRTFTISAADIKNIHKKRRFTFYVWSFDANGKYSKYPLVLTVQNPAPEPQPIRDLVNPNGTRVSVRFAPEVEADILASGRKLHIATDRAFTSILYNVDLDKTLENADYTLSADTVYYFRYGLRDEFTDSLTDILYSGTREIKTGAADFSGTVQYLNNTPPDNAPTWATISIISGPFSPLVRTTLYWDYTQGANVATGIGVIVKPGGGTPTFADQYQIVEANKKSFDLFLPPGLYSYGVFAFAVTKGGVTRNSTISTILNTSNAVDLNLQATGQGSGHIFLGGGDHSYFINVGSDITPVSNNARKIGASGSQFLGVYSQKFYENGVELLGVYALANHFHIAGDLPSTIAYKNAANTFSAGPQLFDAGLSVTSNSAFKPRWVSAGSQPSMADGELMLWYDTGSSTLVLVYFKSSQHYYVALAPG